MTKEIALEEAQQRALEFMRQFWLVMIIGSVLMFAGMVSFCIQQFVSSANTAVMLSGASIALIFSGMTLIAIFGAMLALGFRKVPDHLVYSFD